VEGKVVFPVFPLILLTIFWHKQREQNSR
jgi:hypothetical protein